MDFFYPNRTNMMWEIFGLVFYNDASRLVDVPNKTFRKDEIVQLLLRQGIAIFDTACAVRRLSGNASDKDLQIIEKTDIPQLLSQIPLCHDLVCTGQKSFSVLTEDYGVPVPALGECNEFSIPIPPLSRGGAQRAEGSIKSSTRTLRLWRMPSSSRAFPMKLEEKASYYRRLMQAVGII
jgi:G:T/U-mismatch repair DNA glycosylase